ncbi:MAG: 16S rRNA pseudouridine(516) synthase [Rubrivivax sp.]|nr:16S rRNA pseudouridine(516) synthase [Rubrivivax sp.]
MNLAHLLFTQGFGTRRECAALVAAGRVEVSGRVVDDPDAEVTAAGLVFVVDGRRWPYAERALVLLHKPAGVECSQKPRHHPSVLSLLPAPLRRRGVQPVGRLDEDTTGALLLTDDGALIHRLSSPKRHVAKVYDVTTKHPLDERLVQRLREGVVLADDPRPVRAAACEATGERTLRLTLTEGRYHQVKRMVAAAGNRVEALHRSAFGGLALGALAPGQWRWVDDAERAALLAAGAPGLAGATPSQ